MPFRYTPDEHGGWMMDPEPRDPEDYHKIWTTSGMLWDIRDFSPNLII